MKVGDRVLIVVHGKLQMARITQKGPALVGSPPGMAPPMEPGAFYAEYTTGKWFFPNEAYVLPESEDS